MKKEIAQYSVLSKLGCASHMCGESYLDNLVVDGSSRNDHLQTSIIGVC